MDVKLDGSALRAAVTAARETQEAGDLDGALARWREVMRDHDDDPHGYLGTANLLAKLSRRDEADEVFALGVGRFPDHERMWVERAWSAHHVGDWPEADRRWSDVRARFPDSQPGYFGGGATLRAMRRHDEADALYAEAFARWPDAANLLADHAANAQARGNVGEAAKRWQKLRQVHPGDPESYLRAAREMAQTKHFNRAETILADGAARLPDDPRLAVEFARLAQLRGRPAQALERWEVVITRFPGLPDGYVGAGHALNEQRRFADAQAVILPATRRFADSVELATLFAWIAHYQDDFAEAIKRWEEVRRRFPRHVPGYIGGIASLLALGDMEGAGKLSDGAMAAFPDNMHVAVEHARVARQGGDDAEALARWAAVHARFPAAPPVMLGYARALAKAGETDRAEALLREAAAQNGGDIEIMRALAEVAAQRKDWEAAERRWRRITERHPDKALGWSGLAELLRERGRLDDAVILLREALERLPGSVDLERQLATTFTLKRDWPAALALWDALKRKYPRHGGVLGGIKQALYQARQDLGVAGSEGGAPPFEIPEGLLATAGGAETDEQALGKLFGGFEALGDTCEFGMVQRRFGAEPVSLLRWASINPKNLVAALDTRLEGVGAPEHTVVAVVHGEYVSRDKRYHMFSHTFTPESAEPFERFQVQHLRRIKFLCRKLLEDLAEGDKIFVYKCLQGLSDEEARAIHAAIGRYGGGHALLCVRLEDQARPRGTVEDWGGGLFVGTIDRFSTVNINVDCWVELCRTTEALWHAQKAAA